MPCDGGEMSTKDELTIGRMVFNSRPESESMCAMCEKPQALCECARIGSGNQSTQEHAPATRRSASAMIFNVFKHLRGSDDRTSRRRGWRLSPRSGRGLIVPTRHRLKA